ncbi:MULTISPECIES: MerR family DNA-binding transcriptional regulator [unclassified Mesorhizobium]|jgi:DNA-binding transcriptional MerR regulator|uniref:MerR family transcriptional regulator n=1 Tax=unclassified Mesorhizobium TaxID=325217 RepID=UPI000FD377E1|nr:MULTISPECIES: MerR family DNA-binding transcriptional regulator [unclassified Mesorhizobium]AZV23561.1 MerR family DNA-binding transcriptional regulator [Mesorhizobium sp. M7A.F.Ce.TU.012.03.2.1]RUU80219.1 MerR family DNA-binding transcriptional regulator [Mesorhizobium sp. M7A.F.Ca.MR.362.00.0.0]RUU93000.1 MerR family DNA-binding transcriptional regulator [Mesorhizobium sp. M7A.F.Ca.MR.176.00.0.0]RVD15683.1 MerR family DNA-binding transcriptional regulator [Mesorhizobium sp. M7A.F.Ca.ET.027
MKLISAGETAANTNISAEAGEDLVRIGEMAKKYGVTLRTLRFYEDKGLLNPQRDGSTRLYTRRDKARLKLILLGRKVGFSLRDVKQMMDLYDPTGSNTKQLKLALDKSEKQLARLQKQRALIDDAINELSGSMSAVRQMLSERSAPQASAAS